MNLFFQLHPELKHACLLVSKVFIKGKSYQYKNTQLKHEVSHGRSDERIVPVPDSQQGSETETSVHSLETATSCAYFCSAEGMWRGSEGAYQQWLAPASAEHDAFGRAKQFQP